MASNSSETTPLLSTQPKSAKPVRNVSFNPQVSTSAAPSLSSDTTTGQPVLSVINNRLRRRHSHGAPQVLPPNLPKPGAQRTTKHAQKLKLLPNTDNEDDDEADEESGRDVYSQFTRIKDPVARRDAARLGKEDRERLPRVTAYCTAATYKLDGLMKYLKGRGRLRSAAPKLFDECIYTPFSYAKIRDLDHDETVTRQRTSVERRFSDSVIEVDSSVDKRPENPLDYSDGLNDHSNTGTLVSSSAIASTIDERPEPQPEYVDLDTKVHVPEVFFFEYGVVVVWGMTLQEEERLLKDIAKFETEKLSKDDIQTENFNFYYTQGYQARIYNDFISLREKRHYMTKLAISHALAQSVKTSLYEDLVENTIEDTKEIPAQIATSGKVNLSRKEINMQIGELFILRINIHLQGSVLDSPELMWAEPQLDPIYQAVRSYLEMDQRVGLLTERLDVIADLLAVLKDQLAHTHSETLEWVVIILIGAEILVAMINIIVDVYAGAE